VTFEPEMESGRFQYSFIPNLGPRFWSSESIILDTVGSPYLRYGPAIGEVV